jgi:hypothetical protein
MQIASDESTSDNEGEHSLRIDPASQNTFNTRRLIRISAGMLILCLLVLTLMFILPSDFKSTQKGSNEDIKTNPTEGRDPVEDLWPPSKIVTLDDQVLQPIVSKDIKNMANNVLIGIFTSSTDFQRRILMRNQQINPYKNFTNLTWRFVLGKPSSIYEQAIIYENNTFQDIIVLDNVPDTYSVANSYKTFEYFKYLERNNYLYKYFGKMDTDTFISVPEFWKDCFNETVFSSELTLIGNYIPHPKIQWTQGAFYVISWKIMLILNKLYENVNRRTRHEDLQVTVYLMDAQIKYTRVAIDERRSVSAKAPVPQYWPPRNDTYRVHELKQEELYLIVTGCFTSEGINKTQIEYWTSRSWQYP